MDYIASKVVTINVCFFQIAASTHNLLTACFRTLLEIMQESSLNATMSLMKQPGAFPPCGTSCSQHDKQKNFKA